MEITKEANTAKINEYLDNNESWNNLTLYYDIGYIMFDGEFNHMVLHIFKTDLYIQDYEGEFKVDDDWNLYYNGEWYKLDCYGINI